MIPQVVERVAEIPTEVQHLTLDQVSGALKRLAISNNLTQLGRNFYGDIFDQLSLQPRRETWVAFSLKEARGKITELLAMIYGNVGYITGGLESRHHQILLDSLSVNRISAAIIGLEGDNYIRNKGRTPFLTYPERFSLWPLVAPNGSIIFPLPPKPDGIASDEWYDAITQYLGVWQNPQVVYIGSADDPSPIKSAHLRRAFSPRNVVHITLGLPPVHSSELYT